jgi:hypothetical protein
MKKTLVVSFVCLMLNAMAVYAQVPHGSKSSTASQSHSKQIYCNSDQKVYDDYGSMVCSAYNHTGFQKNATAAQVREWQSKMRQLREKWERQGYRFHQSPWETKRF